MRKACILDEGNRMNEKSWASLTPLLDHCHYAESVVACITIPAHADFRACVSPPSWLRLTCRYERKLFHLPLKRFSGQTVERLRRFHVLNGVEVRSYAADFIRDS